MNRLIPREKLRTWAYADARASVRQNRKRWAYAYMMGASFQMMLQMSRVKPLNAVHKQLHHERRSP